MRHKLAIALLALVVICPSTATRPVVAISNPAAYPHYIQTKVKIDKLLATENIKAVNSSEIARVIVEIVETQDINTITAMAWCETRFRHATVSSGNDRGILQVNPGWHPEYDPKRLLELKYGLEAGYEIFLYKCKRNLRKYNGSSKYPIRIQKTIKRMYK